MFHVRLLVCVVGSELEDGYARIFLAWTQNARRPRWLVRSVRILLSLQADAGALLETYNSCDAAMQARILGYAQAIGKMQEEQTKKGD